MTQPEWDVAIICDETGLTTTEFYDLICRHDGNKMRNHNSIIPSISEEQWQGILLSAKAYGAVSEFSDLSVSPEDRVWKVNYDKLSSFKNAVEIILNILESAKKKYCSSESYRIVATIPDVLYELKEFFRTFENTVLGLRRMISQATSDLTIMVPFMDFDGLSELLPTLKQTLQKGVKINILTRELNNGSRNMMLLSTLIEDTKKNGWDMKLFEIVHAKNTPMSHAKVFSKDEGNEIYIGSANLTAASMIKTIELGVFLKGQQTKPVVGFLNTIKSLSKQKWP